MQIQRPWLQKANQERALKPTEKQIILDLYAKDRLSPREISARVGRGQTAIRGVVQEAGLMRTIAEANTLSAEKGLFTRIGTRHDFFDQLNSESAWVLGLVFGDGWVNRHVLSVSGSEEVVTKVRDLVAPKAKVLRTPTCHVVHVSSILMVRFLRERFGVVPAKSRVMTFPMIPPLLLPHFIRGLWDSDGSLAWNTKHVWKGRSRKYLYAIYASASRSFVEGLANALESNAGLPRRPVERVKKQYTYKKVMKEVSHYVLRFAEQDARRLCEWMYADSANHMRCRKRFGRYQERLAMGGWRIRG